MDGLLHAHEVRGRIHETGEADKDGGKTDQAVQDSHKLRHLGHLHSPREYQADAAAREQGEDQLDIVLGDDSENGREQCDRHADDAVPVALASRFLVGQSAERQDEENRGSDV